MVGTLAQHQRGTIASWLDVLSQVSSVDLAPDKPRRLNGLFVSERRVVLKEAVGILKHGFAQRKKALHVPTLDVAFERIDIDAEVEVVADELVGLCAHLQHVEPLEDQDVGLSNLYIVAFDDVVHHVAIHRSSDHGCAAFEFAEKLQQSLGVVTFGEALAVHNAAVFEHAVGVQEAVGCDEPHLWMIGPTRQQCLQDSGEGALAHGHAAGHADHVGDLRAHRAQEGRAHLLQVLRGADIQVQQAGEREIDRGNFVEIDALVDASQLNEIGFSQREWSGRTQHRPLVAIEGDIAARLGSE